MLATPQVFSTYYSTICIWVPYNMVCYAIVCDKISIIVLLYCNMGER